MKISLADFIYIKQGHCYDCDDDDAALYRFKTTTDLRVVLFVPTCKRCLVDMLSITDNTTVFLRIQQK